MRTHKVFQVTEKKRESLRKHCHSKKSFSYEIYAGTSKAAHKVFQQRSASSIREFSVLQDWVRLQLGMRLQIGVLRYLNKDCANFECHPCTSSLVHLIMGEGVDFEGDPLIDMSDLKALGGICLKMI